MKLYDLTGKYKDLIFKFREAESEEDLAKIADELSELEGTLEEKLDNCARVYRTLEAESDVYKQEAKRLQGKANVLENRADRLKEYIGACLGKGNKAKTELFDFTWRKSTQVVIDREDLVPEIYKRVTTITEPNKVAIKEDLQAGKLVEGAILRENYNLQIK